MFEACLPRLPFRGLAALGLIVAAVALVTINYSPDSMHYVDVARNLARGEGFCTYHLNLESRAVPDPALMWPPLYPLLLAPFLMAGLPVGAAVRIILWLSFAAATGVVYLYSRRLHGSAIAGWVTALWLVLAPALGVWSSALSEAPFTALTTLYLLWLAQASFLSPAPRQMRRLAGAGLLAGLATLCRYAGVAVLAAGSLTLLTEWILERDGKKFSACLAGLTAQLAGFMLVVGPWLARNRIRVGYLSGVPKLPFDNSILENFQRVAATAANDLFMPGLAAIALWLLWRRPEPDQKCAPPASSARPFITAGVYWVLTYVFLLVTLASSYHLDAIDSRMLSPVYGIGLALAPLAMARIPRVSFAGLGAPPRMIGAGLAAVILMVTAANTRVFYQKHSHRFDQVAAARTWILEQAPSRALFIGRQSWWIRFLTGRPVLETGYPAMPPLTTGGVADFLARFGGRFDGYFLLLWPPFPDEQELDRELNFVGYELEGTPITEPQRIYRLLKRSAESGGGKENPGGAASTQ